jgi:hypothetical protein
MKRVDKLPSKKAIARYWCERQDAGDFELDSEHGTTLDELSCFACGARAHLARAHIVAKQFGGADEVCNLVLLCRVCHNDCPDVNDRETVLAWINAREPEVNTALEWARKAIADANLSEADIEQINANSDIRKHLGDIAKLAGFHFGVGMKPSTKQAALTLWLSRQK